MNAKFVFVVQGNVEMVQAFADVGLLGLDPVAELQPNAAPIMWRQVMAKLLDCGDAEG